MDNPVSYHIDDNIPREYEKALKSAFNILDYADNTEKKLREKLARKGNTTEAINFAVDYCKAHGFLNDMRYLLHISERIANVKLYGRRRVIEELYTKGFTREDIELLTFEDIDFAENCAERIRQTGARYSDPEKLKNALLRYGYSWTDIRAALEIIAEEQEN